MPVSVKIHFESYDRILIVLFFFAIMFIGLSSSKDNDADDCIVTEVIISGLVFVLYPFR